MKIQIGCMVLTLLSGWCSATTYYKVGKDPGGSSSFAGSVNATCGWSATAGSTSAQTVISDFSTSDFIVGGGNGSLLRLPVNDNSALTFAGKSLTLADGAQMALKMKDDYKSREVTIHDLRVEGTARIAPSQAGIMCTFKGTITLQPNSTLGFGFDYVNNVSDCRPVTVDSAVVGDETTSLCIYGDPNNGMAGQKSPLTLNNVRDFRGTIMAEGSPKGPVLTVNGAFGGTLTDLPPATTAAWFDFDGLPSETGLRIATSAPSDVVKTKLCFFSPSNDFYRAGQKVLTFPAGAEVNVADFTIKCATSPDDSASELYLETVTNADDTVSFVTKAGRTLYKVGADPRGSSSFYGNASGSAGWSETPGGALATFTSLEMLASDCVNNGQTIRTPTSGAVCSFGGHSLRQIGGMISIKGQANSKVTIPRLILDSAMIFAGNTDTTYTLGGDYTIVSGSSMSLQQSYSGTIVFDAVLHGDETTELGITGPDTGTLNVSFSNLGDFHGTLAISAAQTVTMTMTGAFDGQIGGLTAKSALRVNYDGLTAGRGLCATTLSDALKTKVTFFGTDTDFTTDGLPLLRFPAGTTVNPGEFSVSVATAANCTDAHPIAVKTYVDEADGNAVVLAVNAAKASFAKMEDDGSGTFTWHFYTSAWTDITETCGLTEPDGLITVYFGSSAEFEAIKANPGAAAGYCMSAFAVTDTVDLTSAGFAFVLEPGLNIDLSGHRMTVGASFFSFAMTITDTVGGGELHVNVPSGTTVNNTAVELTGNLKFVKEGGGVFSSNRGGQSYSGGNKVVAGTLTSMNETSANRHHLGAEGTEIWVGSGATFDIAGNYDYYLYHIILAGGTLKSSNANGGFIQQENTGWSGIGWLTLAEDSTFYVRSDVVFSAKNDTPVDLGGHTLTIDASVGAKSVPWQKDVTNGTIRLVGVVGQAVSFRVMGRAIEAKTVDLVDGAGLNMETAMNVRDYVAALEWDNPNCAGSAALNVYGAFRPETDYFYGCTLQDGATLDLSTRTAACPITGAATNGKGLKTVTFADNATIAVDLGNRRVKSGDLLLAWDPAAKPTNLATLKFKLADGQRGTIVKAADGLRLVRGMAILVR